MTDPNTRTVLVVEDDPGLQSQIRWCLADDAEVEVADGFDAAVSVVRRKEPDVVTLDLGLPPDPGGSTEGFRLLEEILKLAPETKIIVLTGREEHEHAVRAVGVGAFDFYRKPVESETLRFVVDRAFRIRALEKENARLARNTESVLDGVVGSSAAMQRVQRYVERVGPTDVSVLVKGETGTGKELIARALHDQSPRAAGPFVAINCAAIPENLLESELFGYEKGAFTGASSQKKGKIENASGGTLFLDEIGDMPLTLQSKMLRFLQERAVDRLGGSASIPVDVRVVCATHRDLSQMITEQTFREDLFYRLTEVTIDLPPIRDRGGDSILIATSLLRRFASEQQMPAMEFSEDARHAIEAWNWPGNVREMENRVKRAVILSDTRRVTAEDLELAAPDDTESMPLNLREVREAAERAAIVRVLALSEGNISKSARLLGVTRPTLYSLLEKHGLGAAG